MAAKLWCILGALVGSLGDVSMGALLYFVRLGLTWYVYVVESAATRRGGREWVSAWAWAWACAGAVGSSCGMAPSRACGGTVKVDGSADTAEVWLSVDVVKCRPCSVPARCLSACESCDGSCGVEGQYIAAEGWDARQSIARISALRQGWK